MGQVALCLAWLAGACIEPHHFEGADAGFSQTISIGATHATRDLPFAVTIDGTSANVVFDIRDDVGTIRIGTRPPTPVLVYNRYDAVPGVFDYDVIGVDPEWLTYATIFCDGERLAFIWYDDTRGRYPIGEEATGNCPSSWDPRSVQVDFPPFAFAPTGAWPTFTVTGALISRDGSGPGTVNLGGRRFTFFPYTSIGCLDCADPWWSAHVVLWDPARATAGVAALYLFPKDEPLVLQRAITLPDLADPAGYATFDATWSR